MSKNRQRLQALGALRERVAQQAREDSRSFRYRWKTHAYSNVYHWHWKHERAQLLRGASRNPWKYVLCGLFLGCGLLLSPGHLPLVALPLALPYSTKERHLDC